MSSGEWILLIGVVVALAICIAIIYACLRPPADSWGEAINDPERRVAMKTRMENAVMNERDAR